MNDRQIAFTIDPIPMRTGIGIGNNEKNCMQIIVGNR